jgi:hypothetical protein
MIALALALTQLLFTAGELAPDGEVINNIILLISAFVVVVVVIMMI